MDTSSIAYKRAFEAYMRYGTPIGLLLKQAHPTTHYIWRTRGDGKVRSSHAANDGKIFAWDDPPPTGHPGEDYGCRRTAEPYYPDGSEFFDITLQAVKDTGPAWTNYDYSWHYFFGAGKEVTLRESCNLEKVVAEYRRIVIDDPKKRPGQIADIARKKTGEFFSYEFGKAYPMRHVVFSLGGTTIGGKFTGRCQKADNALLISGSIAFYLRDEFRDPLDIGTVLDEIGINPLIDEIISGAIANGISDIAEISSRIRDKIGNTVFRVLRTYVVERIKQTFQETSEQILRRLGPWAKRKAFSKNSISRKDLRELPFSTYYSISDDWSGTVSAKVYIDDKRSRISNLNLVRGKKRRRWLSIFVICFGLFAFLILYVQIAERYECVVMPNGLLIGRATFFSQMFEDRHGLPDIAIKYPDGRLLRRGDGEIEFYDSESVGGDFPGSFNGRNNSFIYVNGVGLLIESEDPERFQYYWDKKKSELSDVSPKTIAVNQSGNSTWRWSDVFTGFNANLYLVYTLLNENPKNRRRWCPTPWFSP